MGNARFYVYAHVKEEDGTIFYIGKGCKRRAWDTSNRNRRWNFFVRKHKYKVVLLADKLTEQQALDEEAELIKHFKSFETLVNILDSGEINPMSDPEIVKRMVETKRQRNQYSGETIKKYNTAFKEKFEAEKDFRDKVTKDRVKAAKTAYESKKKQAAPMIDEILSLKKQGKKQYEISKMLGVSQAAVSRIVNGKAYA